MLPKVTTRKLKPGEALAKTGEKPTCAYLVQEGCLSYFQTKGNKIIEIGQTQSPESIGEETLFGTPHSHLKAMAIRDTTLVELPLSLLREQLEPVSGSKELKELKVLLKAVSDRFKSAFSELRNAKVNAEVQPCPAESTSKLFGTLFHTSRILGRKDHDIAEVDWKELKNYASAVFDESPLRLESGLNILIKLGYATVRAGQVRITGMKQLESFFEYYGNYYFKGSAAEFLKTNSKSTAVTEAFLEVAGSYPVDRGGNAHVPFKPAIDAMKTKLGPGFEADQLFRLEQKGLFMKRLATNDGGTLVFYRPDFEQMLLNWKILREVELWNEQGYVDMGAQAALQVASNSAPPPALKPEVERRKWAALLSKWKPPAGLGKIPALRTAALPSDGELWCSMCMSIVQKDQAVCQVCGHVLPRN